MEEIDSLWNARTGEMLEYIRLHPWVNKSQLIKYGFLPMLVKKMFKKSIVQINGEYNDRR